MYGSSLPRPVGLPHLAATEASAASDLSRQPCACRCRDHQAPGGLPRTQTVFDGTLETTTQVKRKRCGHGMILLKQEKSQNTTQGKKPIQRSNKTL
ncbi:hypothetical protein, partial [Pseudochelatococcus sp.]|uniref:hypothetical protein n=1 Tax=Pseudochelatococcus sp. TaxID=2020869 RepID=UPI003D93D151